MTHKRALTPVLIEVLQKSTGRLDMEAIFAADCRSPLGFFVSPDRASVSAAFRTVVLATERQIRMPHRLIMKDYRQGAFHNPFEQHLSETVRDAVNWSASYVDKEVCPRSVRGEVYHNIEPPSFTTRRGCFGAASCRPAAESQSKPN